MVSLNELKRAATALVATLRESGRTVTSAESCTGGLVAKLITDIAGSSDCFGYGFVTYSNDAKQSELGVSAATLDRDGAVSKATVREMARGALKRSRASLAVAISGIAGPGGGSDDKPVGTVWFAFAARGHATVTECHCFPGDRDGVRRAAALRALEGLAALHAALPHTSRPG